MLAMVYESPQRRACMEMRLVLEAVGLSARVSQGDGQWRVLVAEEQATAAIAELSSYTQEESAVGARLVPNPASIGTAVVESALVFGAMLVTFSTLRWTLPSGETFAQAGHVDAGLVQAGQWWRSLTALTLHLDLPHLLSNLAFGTLFLIIAGRCLGGGIALLLTVFAGAAGNLVNAYLHDASHTSLGASTAVFAALGIAVAHALRPSLRNQPNAMRRWSPLIGGAVLLAMTGTGGERTDVGAHLTGFLSGLAFGWFSVGIPNTIARKPWIQWTASAGGVAAIAIAWHLALPALR